MPAEAYDLSLHLREVGRHPLFTLSQERWHALRVRVARDRYRAAALALDHPARSLLAAYRKVRDGYFPVRRWVREAITEGLSHAAVQARLPQNLATLAALTEKAGTLARAGWHERADRVRAKCARLLAELGVPTEKLAGLVEKAALTPPHECGETAESLRRKVELVRRRKAKYEAEKGAFARANLRLVARSVRKFGRRGIDHADLYQSGYLGLLDAVDKYELGRKNDKGTDNKFSTMAVGWVEQKMRKCIADTARTVRVPAYLQDLAAQSHWAKTDLGGADPDAEAVAERLRAKTGRAVTAADVAKAEWAVRPIGRVDAPDEDGPDTLAGREADAHDGAGTRERAEAVRRLVRVLPYTERWTVRLLFGLADGYSYTLHEIGKVFGFTRQRATQVRDAALARLRGEGIGELLHGHCE